MVVKDEREERGARGGRGEVGVEGGSDVADGDGLSIFLFPRKINQVRHNCYFNPQAVPNGLSPAAVKKGCL